MSGAIKFLENYQTYMVELAVIHRDMVSAGCRKMRRHELKKLMSQCGWRFERDDTADGLYLCFPPNVTP